MSTTRRAPLNLAKLVPDLPEVILPNGRTVQMVPLTARGYELFLAIRRAMRDGEHADANGEQFVDDVDELLALVLPDATADDVASFGVRVELKLAVIMAASGAVDQVLDALRDEVNTDGSEGNG